MTKRIVTIAALIMSTSALAGYDATRSSNYYSHDEEQSDGIDCQAPAEEAAYAEFKSKNPYGFGDILSHITDVVVRRGYIVSYHITIDATMGGTSRKWINYTVRTSHEDGSCRILKVKKFAM